MANKTIIFEFMTGLKRSIFRNARLWGNWDSQGRHADAWTEIPMAATAGDDGCPMFRGSADLDDSSPLPFRWGVMLDGPQGSNFWGIPREVQDAGSTNRYREFRIGSAGTRQVERYYLTHCRRLGAHRTSSPSDPTGLRFGVWAPNALRVEVVFAENNGYIAADGTGIDRARAAVVLSATTDGVWEGHLPGLFDQFLGTPYMYRVTNAQGDIVYRSDIFSRSQAGKGRINPASAAWPGTTETLDGTVSCSLVVDPDMVRRGFESTPPGLQADLIPADEFWAHESTPGLPVPSRVEDLVIYELHVGSLGFGNPEPGDLGDAMEFLDHLTDLGVNAVELLPMAEFDGNVGWGYGNSHHLCIESSAGGRDKYRHFVRECHRRGIAVIQDVVYNHYAPEAERAEWNYDSTAPEQNNYYWYEGKPGSYASEDGGYLDNGSTGFTPRFWEENVRQMFISGAAFLMEEMHVDGLRVDLTQAIHRDNRLHADGRSVGNANIFGQKFLREWSRTLRMIRPTVMLIAEDHTGWDAVVKLPNQGGLGFDARWEASFYHGLIGDSDMSGGAARLLKRAGYGNDDEIPMDRFAGVLFQTGNNQVVFHESHDEAGNASGTERTLVTAVNGAALLGVTRSVAESRARVCFGLSVLSAGTPMFFMGEEIGAQKNYTFDNFMANRENIAGERAGNGKQMFEFYRELITLARRFRSMRSHNIEILHVSNSNRVIAFKRWMGVEEAIIVASLNDHPFAAGYGIEKDTVAIPASGWREIFNSDAARYGGDNIGNGGAVVESAGGRLEVVIPARGFVVFLRQ